MSGCWTHVKQKRMGKALGRHSKRSMWREIQRPRPRLPCNVGLLRRLIFR